ncbi:DUF3298 and DUF4163 domain-containing protein [Bacillus marasmi]|uniref:DUF3298 and DUF4163 domain-containing protein n=1 Tax=Bacillus marasmi TaxID=1926279 RepID=UPI0011C9F79A|nr:DUF3298 and DUF4163 domain-containing protein [Bacillus marasmi]
MFQQPAIVQVLSQINEKRKIQIYYPVILGLTNTTAQDTINQKIIKTFNRLLQDRDYHSPYLVELNGWFEIKNNQRGILSLALYVYSYTGGAHGMTTVRTLTFETTTGKNYSLDELFKPNSDYQNVLMNMITDQIKTREIPVISTPIVFPGNNNYYLADKSLILYYQLYDLAPYYYGITYFPINIYEIQKIIDENGPLGKLMGSN